MAWTRTLFAMSFVSVCCVGVVLSLVGVDTRMIGGVVHVIVFVVVVVVAALRVAFELVNLFVGAGQGMWSPFWSPAMVNRAVVTSPCDSGISGGFASAFMVLLYVGSYSLDVLVAP